MLSQFEFREGNQHQECSTEPETLNVIANLPDETDVFQLLDQQTRNESAESFLSNGSERTRSQSAQIVEGAIHMGAKICQSENKKLNKYINIIDKKKKKK